MGSNKTGLNKMGVNKTDELIVNKMGIKNMGLESWRRHHYYHTDYGKGKYNGTPRKAKSF